VEKSPTGGTWLRRISAENERNASPDGNDRSPEVRARAATLTAAGGEMEMFQVKKTDQMSALGVSKRCVIRSPRQPFRAADSGRKEKTAARWLH